MGIVVAVVTGAVIPSLTFFLLLFFWVIKPDMHRLRPLCLIAHPYDSSIWESLLGQAELLQKRDVIFIDSDVMVNRDPVPDVLDKYRDSAVSPGLVLQVRLLLRM